MNWYLHCWKKCLTFSGRARRKEYWMFVLWTCLLTAGFIVVSIIAGPLEAVCREVFCGTVTEDELILPDLCANLRYAFLVACWLPYWAVSVRRLHDLNRRALEFFVQGVPFVGLPVWLVLMVLRGTRGANRYGEDPREERPRGGGPRSAQ